MKDLKIGDKVIVIATSVMYYEDYERKAFREPKDPFEAVIVGQCYKYTGTYIPGRRGNIFYGDDYEQASLNPGKRLTFWLVRTDMKRKPLMVADEDLTTIQGIDI